MYQAATGQAVEGGPWEGPARWFVHFIQALFVGVMLFQLDAPFLSAHNERQNHTFEMARHVFHDGWRSIVTPKVSDTVTTPGYETQRYTAVLQEVPFHGVIGWPLALFTSHERAVVRLVSTAFALIAIQLLYWIIRAWLPPAPSAAGAALWAMAPLTLHFGQAPVPDILCTAGMLAAFWFAQRGKLPASSGCFLFAILAKLSVIPFGLPVLVALLVARDCRSVRSFARLSLAWGWAPLLGLLMWHAALKWFAPPTVMTLGLILQSRGSSANLVSASFYKFLVGCFFPFGLGVLGFAGTVFALRPQPAKMDPRIKWAVIYSNLFYLVSVLVKIAEPQYMLPVLAWGAVAASFGFNLLLDKLRSSAAWRIGFGALLAMHVLVAVAFTIDLKASRVPEYPDIERAARLLPPEARVVVVYRYLAGCSPVVWLNRNTITVWEAAGMAKRFSELRRFGFTHVLIMDVESWHNDQSAEGPLALARRLLKVLRGAPPETGANLPGYANPSSPFRVYCDQHFWPLFVAPHVVLYSMDPPPPAK
jgi:hypothetical protein